MPLIVEDVFVFLCAGCVDCVGCIHSSRCHTYIIYNLIISKGIFFSPWKPDVPSSQAAKHMDHGNNRLANTPTIRNTLVNMLTNKTNQHWFDVSYVIPSQIFNCRHMAEISAHSPQAVGHVYSHKNEEIRIDVRIMHKYEHVENFRI